jgi:hypothetical protein
MTVHQYTIGGLPGDKRCGVISSAMQAASYYVGYLKILGCASGQERLGNFDLKQFHHVLLNDQLPLFGAAGRSLYRSVENENWGLKVPRQPDFRLLCG